MPIGKNSIKRVVNGGYSAVKSEAPDMENSEVREAPEVSSDPITETEPKRRGRKPGSKNKKTAEPVKPEPKKRGRRPAAKPEPEAPKKTKRAKRTSDIPTPPEVAMTVSEVGGNETASVSLGDEMPVYLL